MPVAIAETTRGGITESVHYGVVVAVDATGEVIASAGDPETVVFFRSSAKPFRRSRSREWRGRRIRLHPAGALLRLSRRLA